MQTVVDSSNDKPKRQPKSPALLVTLALLTLALLAALAALLVQNTQEAEAEAAQDVGACAAPSLDEVVSPPTLNAAGGLELNLRPDPASLLQTMPKLEPITDCATASP